MALDGARLVTAGVLPAAEVDDAVAFCLGVEPVRIAIDAPSGRSPLAHADDTTLAPKFRVARCGEVALGREVGVWVPWVAPPVGGADVAAWIEVGFALFAALADAGVEAVETYPHAVFRSLAGGARIPGKSSPAGLLRRVELLRGAGGVVEPTLPLWGHDGLDACAAALVATSAEPRVVTCGHDGSSIWLPCVGSAPS